MSGSWRYHLVKADGRVGRLWEHVCGAAMVPVSVCLWASHWLRSPWPLIAAALLSVFVGTFLWRADVRVNGGPMSKPQAPPRMTCVWCALWMAVLLLVAAQAYESGRWPWTQDPVINLQPTEYT